MSLEGSFAELQSYLESESKTCPEWAIPVIQAAMKVDVFPVLLEISITVNGCSAGSILLDFDLQHSNEDVLQLAASNLNSATTVLDEQRSVSLNVLAVSEDSATTTRIPTASPVVSDASSSSSSFAGSTVGLVIIVIFIVLFVVVIILLVVVLLTRGKSQKNFNEAQQNIAVEMGSNSQVASSDAKSTDEMLGTGDNNVVPVDIAVEDEKDIDLAAQSQAYVLNEIVNNGNASTAGELK